MILFTIGKVNIYIWGLMVNLGFFISLFIGRLESKRRGVKFFDIFELSILLYTSGIVGAWLSNFWLQKSAVGFMFIGGAIAAFVVSVIYAKSMSFLRGSHPELVKDPEGHASKCRDSSLPQNDGSYFLQLADVSIVAAVFGMFFGRIGCFLVNDHLGSITSAQWAISGRHPVILYLLINLAILIVLLNYLKYRIHIPGGLFLIGVIYYSITRFILDFFRCSDLWICDLRFQSLTATQWMLIPIFLISVVFLIKICYLEKRIREQKSGIKNS